MSDLPIQPSLKPKTNRKTDYRLDGTPSAPLPPPPIAQEEEEEQEQEQEQEREQAQPLAAALSNARKTTLILHHLSSLLTQLLALKTASGCPMTIPPDPRSTADATTDDNNPWILQVLLSLHPTLDHSPAGLHALQRLCTHACYTAADDLSALHDQASVSPKRMARFVAKWGDSAAWAFEGVEDAGTLPRGETEISIAGCLEFAAAFAKLWAGRKGRRVRGAEGVGWIRRVVYDAGEKATGGDVALRVGLAERCRGNVEHVLALLGYVVAELDAEIGRRAMCVHWPITCRTLAASDAELWVAKGNIDRVVVEVEGDREALMGWEDSRVGAGIWGGMTDEEGRRGGGKVRCLRRWMRLSEREGGWGWGLGMRADEIVRRICVGKWVDFGGGGGGAGKGLELKSW